MARRLEGKRVALTGPRRWQELAKLVQNMGGTPLLRPAQGTVMVDDDALRDGIEDWLAQSPDWAVFTTGMGLSALFQKAEEMNRLSALEHSIRHTRIAARGYKTVNALKDRGLKPLVRDGDGSTEGLIRAFAGYDLKDCHMIIQLHGEPAPRLTGWLTEQGARYKELLPYRHVAPPEEELERLLSDMLLGRLDAVTFTSSSQVRFLLGYAELSGRKQELVDALSGPVLAVAVGKVTAQGLREAGLQRVIAPAEERMGSMLVELARYYASQRD